ncbi:Hypothetical protein CINCED_3A025859 [Cinara cedri]|uniref:Uncharacterized protein n=1 Tax=Cinara cedri TaxID=506608 RepID=A0A5E4NCJ6_9HEMI|nr:Hypothetical protein CINCED_3A025859 [Cinara cedri]
MDKNVARNDAKSELTERLRQAIFVEDSPDENIIKTARPTAKINKLNPQTKASTVFKPSIIQMPQIKEKIGASESPINFVKPTVKPSVKIGIRRSKKKSVINDRLSNIDSKPN